MSRGQGTAAAIAERPEGEDFDLTPDEEEALLEAIAEDERDEVIPWDDLVAQLRRR